ncbi:hypothetical protein AHAS_Ahas20G0089900 [Arachis hypogaea]
MRERERKSVWVENTERGSIRNQIKDPRAWNREEYRRLENESFSIFVDNLLEDVLKRELFQLFCWTRRINDIYLSRKQKSGSIYIFAFIRYTTKGGALKAITKMNRMRLRGKVVFVGEAKYRRVSDVKATRNVQERSDMQNENPRQSERDREIAQLPPARGSKDVTMDKKVQDPHGNEWTKKMEGIVAKENLDWLQKSLIGGTTTAIDFKALNLLNVEETYTFKMNSLLQIFHNVWRWDEFERSESRRVWLECYGISLHIWSVDTFKMIGGQWGEVVACDKVTESCTSFSVGRILIDTCVMDMINEWIHITLGTSGFDVLVREVGKEVYSLQCCSENVVQEVESGDHRDNGRSTVSDDVAVTSPILTKFLDDGDQAAVVVTEGRRKEVEDEDRMVNSEAILNEWSYDNLRLNQTNLVMHQPINVGIEGIADFGGYEESYEADSELTIPWNYKCKLNRLVRGIKTNKEVREDNWAKNRGPSLVAHGQEGGVMTCSGLVQGRPGRVDRDPVIRTGSGTSPMLLWKNHGPARKVVEHDCSRTVHVVDRVDWCRVDHNAIQHKNSVLGQ